MTEKVTLEISSPSEDDNSGLKELSFLLSEFEVRSEFRDESISSIRAMSASDAPTLKVPLTLLELSAVARALSIWIGRTNGELRIEIEGEKIDVGRNSDLSQLLSIIDNKLHEKATHESPTSIISLTGKPKISGKR